MRRATSEMSYERRSNQCQTKLPSAKIRTNKNFIFYLIHLVFFISDFSLFCSSFLLICFNFLYFFFELKHFCVHFQLFRTKVSAMLKPNSPTQISKAMNRKRITNALMNKPTHTKTHNKTCFNHNSFIDSYFIRQKIHRKENQQNVYLTHSLP